MGGWGPMFGTFPNTYYFMLALIKIVDILGLLVMYLDRNYTLFKIMLYIPYFIHIDFDDLC